MGGTLTIDLGNSTLSWQLFSDGVVAARYELTVCRPLPKDLFAAVPSYARNPLAVQVLISSVVPDLDDQLSALCRSEFAVEPVYLDYRSPKDLRFSIDNPAELGADRIAACLGALELCPAPLIVIDSGTATTFDLVDADRVYQGGAIAPGLNLLIKSLSQNTAKLKEVEFAMPRSLIAKNTRDHIRVGVYHYFMGGIERLVGVYRRLMGDTVTVIACGGAFRHLAALPAGIDRYEADLVHIGLRRFGGVGQ